MLLLVSVLLGALHAGLTLKTNIKAASPYTNCDCQCSHLTFQDKWGQTHGNCKSADNTGATWCYVDARSSCVDKQESTRFWKVGKKWSYQACSTPSLQSPQCGGGYGGSSGSVVCKHGGPGCSPVGGSGGYGNGGYGNGGYGGSPSGQFGTGNQYGSGSSSGGSISNCRHGQNCNVGYNPGSSSGQYGSSGGQYGSSGGQYGSSGSQYGSSGSVTNCRYGQNCNVGSSSGQYNTGSSSGQSSGQYNPYGSSSGQYGTSSGQYGSSGSQFTGSLGSILSGRKTGAKDGAVTFSK